MKNNGGIKSVEELLDRALKCLVLEVDISIVNDIKKIVDSERVCHKQALTAERSRAERLEKEVAYLKGQWEGTTAIIQKGTMTKEDFLGYQELKARAEKLRGALEKILSMTDQYPDDADIGKVADDALASDNQGDSK